MHALLLRRPGPEGEGERKEDDEDLTDVEAISGLWRVVEWVKARNRADGLKHPYVKFHRT
jgi:hypothetical protein